jgi:hypothetical protein
MTTTGSQLTTETRSGNADTNFPNAYFAGLRGLLHWRCYSFTAHECLIALMMVAARTSETSVNFYQTTRRNNPEDI